MKRFYKSVAVGPGNRIALDGSMLKTPRGATLALPTAGLAEAIAREWSGQDGEIRPSGMPLTRLANAAVDGVAERSAEVRDEILRYAGHDHLCYRAAEPPELVRRQRDAWDPLLDWTAERYGARLLTQTGIGSVSQPAAAMGALRRAIEGFDFFALAPLHVMASISGSLVLALAVANGRLSGREAFALSRIDECFQAEKWGLDSEAEARAKRLEEELGNAERFLGLLQVLPLPLDGE
jgi:chaperone required for assembly of F1-ATPase